MNDNDDILSDLDFDTPESEATDVTELSDYELSNLHSDVRTELLKSGEMHSEQRSERGKELHSLLLAVTVEMRNRGW